MLGLWILYGLTQAQLVALDGFAGMTDEQLRRAIRRTTGDSTWQLHRRPHPGTVAIEDAALELIGSASGDGGDGGDSSDGGDD